MADYANRSSWTSAAETHCKNENSDVPLYFILLWKK